MNFEWKHCGPENSKVQAQKKLVKSNKTKIFFDQIPLCAISKMAKNQFLQWEKI